MQYSYAFRKLYIHFDKINDKEFGDSIKLRHGLSAYEFNCLRIDVKTKFEQVTTNKSNIESEIIQLEEDIKELNDKSSGSRKETRLLFRLNKKLTKKSKSLPKDITFGTRVLMKQISFLNNDKVKNKESIKEKKQEYLSNRILPINYVGSLNDKSSNRYFDFDFPNKRVVYKPNAKTRVELKYQLGGAHQELLCKLHEFKDSKILPISVRLTTNHLHITFENELLTDYSFDKKKFFKELSKIPKEEEKQRKAVAVKYKKEQEGRMLVGKVKDRYCAIDLNPEYIGMCVVDKKGFKITEKKTYDLTELTTKSGEASDDKKSIYKNNKRKYEICGVYKKIFELAIHYRCSHFVIEDLNFKPNNEEQAREFNRKTKNIWNLNLQLGLIKKHCTNNGIKLVEINPVYSSFIGNIIYRDFDAVNASLEICRRGMHKYDKGNNFYPELTGTIIDTVIERFSESLSDVQLVKDCDCWGSLYKLMKQAKCKYRWQLCDLSLSRYSLNNKKSGVNILRLS